MREEADMNLHWGRHAVPQAAGGVPEEGQQMSLEQSERGGAILGGGGQAGGAGTGCWESTWRPCGDPGESG